MGGTAAIVGRVAAGALTLGGTEALGVGKKAGSVTSQTFLPGSEQVGKTLGIQSNSSAPAQDAPVTPNQTDAEREREARLAADKRRREFQNLGRSSTILTGPGGLTGLGAGSSKTLLGS